MSYLVLYMVYALAVIICNSKGAELEPEETYHPDLVTRDWEKEDA